MGTWKWGVILGVCNDIQIVQRLMVSDASLKSRVLVVDVTLSDSRGHAFLHRIFAVYAPWNPGGNSANFWAALADMCNSTPHGLRHSMDASGSVLQLLGYLTSDIHIRRCGCAQISISGASTLQISVYVS